MKTPLFTTTILSFALGFGIAMHASAAQMSACDKQLIKAREAVLSINFDRRTEVVEIIPACVNEKLVLSGKTSSPEILDRILSTLKQNKVHALDQVKLLPVDENLQEKHWGLISVPVASLHSQPKFAASFVTQATMGTPVRRLQAKDSWFQVQTPDGYLGWIHRNQMKTMDTEELGTWNSSELLITVKTHVRAESQDSRHYIVLPEGSIVQKIGESRKHYFVEFPSKRRAFISKKSAENFSKWAEEKQQLISNNRAAFFEDVLKTADSLLGTSYQWGGNSTLAVDCSGFINTIFRLNGLILPRDSDQLTNIKGMLKHSPEFGKFDLLFFGKEKDDKVEIQHVGIGTAQQEFFHALGDVHRSSLKESSEIYDNYEKNRFLFSLQFPTKLLDDACTSTFATNPFYAKVPHTLRYCAPLDPALLREPQRQY